MNYNTTATTTTTTTTTDISGLTIRPTNQEKFRATVGRRILEEVLAENLAGHIFESNNAEQLSNSLADKIRNRLKGHMAPACGIVIPILQPTMSIQMNIYFVKQQYLLYFIIDVGFMNAQQAV
ncbi:Dynein light chain Tctex-type protein 2B [Dirofilaria immitis]